MKVRILEDKECSAYKLAKSICIRHGHKVYFDGVPDVAIAPLLTQKISIEEINEPLFGTLIFHPSPLKVVFYSPDTDI